MAKTTKKAPVIKLCRECKLTTPQSLSVLKTAIRENSRNLPNNVTEETLGIVNDYVYKNKIKKPQHRTSLKRMAIGTTSFWGKKRRLTVSFMGGHPIVRERIEKNAKLWMDHCGMELKFLKNPLNPTDIRISFDYNDGCWSYIGTDNTTIPAHMPTMNYGWLYPDTDESEFHRTVLHEFGHALGCIHEHQHPKGGIPWDLNKAYAYYSKRGWSKRDVDQQVLQKYAGNLIRESVIDKKSIMMYPIPKELTIGGYEVKWNDTFSNGDIEYIGKVYPK